MPMSKGNGGAASAASDLTPTDVLLFAPNLVGYVRIACTLGSLYLARTSFLWSGGLYFLAFVGDAVDGIVARKLNQFLDMVTDRCATAGLLFVLSGLYTEWSFLFCCLMLLDLFSHWMHVQSVALSGSSSGHKSEKSLKGRLFLIRMYYGNYYFFGYCCVGTELLYIFLYLLSFDPQMMLPLFPVSLSALAYYVCLPACVCKQIVNFAQLSSASLSIAQLDVDKRLKKQKA